MEFQGQIQDFLIGVQIYKGGFDLYIVPDFLLFLPAFSEMEYFVSKGGSSDPLELPLDPHLNLPLNLSLLAATFVIY